MEKEDQFFKTSRRRQYPYLSLFKRFYILIYDLNYICSLSQYEQKIKIFEMKIKGGLK